MAKNEGLDLRQKWDARITRALKYVEDLHTTGDKIIDTYRIETKNTAQKDKYNILYSNTETIKPTLYAQTPKPEVKQDQRDQNNPIARGASLLLETSLKYCLEKQDFDDAMNSTILDFLLPGMGTMWVRYIPTFTPVNGSDGKSITDENGGVVEEVTYETVAWDYVNWKDFLFNKARRWGEVWWVAKGVWMDKAEVRDRFGKDIAAIMSFSSDNDTGKKNTDTIEPHQARVWEIWDKKNKKVIWFSPNYEGDLLDVKDDPLHLEHFFPCPRPLLSVKTNNTILPRPFYAQYQAQGDELNDITLRIRLLVKALRVVGVYDASMEQLKNLLVGTDNKMVPVEGWAMVQDKGGIKGVTDFLPITEVANVLLQLYDARERVKGEIYEITGWSDIIRGVSKASETLGAQELKAEWAGSRLKTMQREIQRFIRDLFRIGAEIISEHFNEGTLALIAGLKYYPPNHEIHGIFQQVVQTLRNDRDRCTLVTVETDSTLMPDEANDRKERMEFLGAAGAFLQQAVPAAKETPALGPLLGEILMFVVRSFRSSRSLEQYFEEFRTSIQQGAQQPAPDEGKEDSASKLQATMMQVQAKKDESQQKAQIEGQQMQQDAAEHSQDIELERQKETNRHNEKMAELAIRDREAAVKEAELGLNQKEVDIKRDVAEGDLALRARDTGNSEGD